MFFGVALHMDTIIIHHNQRHRYCMPKEVCETIQLSVTLNMALDIL